MLKRSLLLCFVSLFVLLSTVNAQYSCTTCPPPGATLKIVWNGDDGYKPVCVFRYSITSGLYGMSHDFSSPSSRTFTAASGSSFGDIEAKVINNGYSRWGFKTTYYHQSTNSMQIGVEYSNYLDTWNGKNWYFYQKKVTANEWHYWIKGSF